MDPLPGLDDTVPRRPHRRIYHALWAERLHAPDSYDTPVDTVTPPVAGRPPVEGVAYGQGGSVITERRQSGGSDGVYGSVVAAGSMEALYGEGVADPAVRTPGNGVT